MAMTYPLRTVRGPEFGLVALPISYAEAVDGGYRERDDGPATEATRVCYVRWSDAQAFRQAVLPMVMIAPATESDYVSRLALVERPNDADLTDLYNWTEEPRRKLLRLDPEPHPRKPWLHAVSADVTGVGAATMTADGRIAFVDGRDGSDGVARVIVTYRKLPYHIGISDATTNRQYDGLTTRVSDGVGGGEFSSPGCELPRYVSREFKPASDSFPIRGGPNTQLQEFGGRPIAGGAFGGKIAVFVADDKSLITEDLTKVGYKCHVIYTWHMVPAIPAAAGQIIGCVNDHAPFDYQGLKPAVGSRRWASDTLYEYPEIGDPYPMVDGTIVRDIKYHCLYRRPGHNYVFRSSLVYPSPARPVVPGFFRPLGPTREYAGWVLAFRRLPADTDPSWNATIDNTGQFGFRPGDTLYRYADLNSLFQINEQGVD